MAFNVKNSLHLFTSTKGFIDAEEKMKIARNEMLDAIQKFGEIHELTIRQQNDMLEQFCNDLKTNLFSGDPLRKKY